MKTATLFPDDDNHNTADEWNGKAGAAPVPYHNGTLASRAAAEFIRPSVNSQTSRVLDFLKSQGDHGASDKELQAALNMPGDSQRPRRVWLRDHGFIVAKGEPEEIVLRDGSTVWVVAPSKNESVETIGR